MINEKINKVMIITSFILFITTSFLIYLLYEIRTEIRTMHTDKQLQQQKDQVFIETLDLLGTIHKELGCTCPKADFQKLAELRKVG